MAAALALAFVVTGAARHSVNAGKRGGHGGGGGTGSAARRSVFIKAIAAQHPLTA